MLWFTGSATEGLPFIHDSFRANPKAVQHRPRHTRPPPHAHSGASTARAVTSKDVSKEVLESEGFKLPAVDCSTTTTTTTTTSNSNSSNSNSNSSSSSKGQVTSQVLDRGGDKAKDPSSFTSYMHRYKACARLKGISPSRAYCVTRMRSTSSDIQDASPTRLSLRDSPHLSFVIPLSNLRMEPVTTPASGAKDSDSSPADLPPILPQDRAEAETAGCSALERQIEEKLRNDRCQDDGMLTHGKQRGGAPTPRGPGRKGERRRRRRRQGSGGVGRIPGGGRPLGDIVSPRRLQDLLNQEEERTLPHTYYSIPLDGKDPDRLDIETPH